MGDEPETAGEAISAKAAALSASALDDELDALLAGLIRDGEIGRFPETATLTSEIERRVISRTVKVHVPEPDPAPKPTPVSLPPKKPIPARTTTYSNAYDEALEIPVAAELDH